MKRKDFIQRVGYLGAGLSLTPWKLLSAKQTVQTFVLPKTSVHIPHGNFAASELEKLFLPELGLECTAQLFMRNGIEPCDKDLKVFTFRQENEFLNICFTRAGDAFIDGQLRAAQIGMSSFHDESFTVRPI